MKAEPPQQYSDLVTWNMSICLNWKDDTLQWTKEVHIFITILQQGIFVKQESLKLKKMKFKSEIHYSSDVWKGVVLGQQVLH